MLQAWKEIVSKKMTLTCKYKVVAHEQAVYNAKLVIIHLFRENQFVLNSWMGNIMGHYTNLLLQVHEPECKNAIESKEILNSRKVKGKKYICPRCRMIWFLKNKEIGVMFFQQVKNVHN